jgi:hypothetical protein
VGKGWATLNGGNTGSVVTVNEAVTAAIKGLTITGGSGSAAPSNTEQAGRIVGGGIYNNNGSLTITNSTVSGNTRWTATAT